MYDFQLEPKITKKLLWQKEERNRSRLMLMEIKIKKPEKNLTSVAPKLEYPSHKNKFPHKNLIWIDQFA